MKKYKVIISIFALATGFLSPAQAKDLVCPTPEYIQNWEKDTGRYFSRGTMYGPMVEGASDTSRGMVIVDENDWGNNEMLKNYPKMNESLFDQYDNNVGSKGLRGTYAKSYAYKGIFKIAYRYNATECRRQIILGKHQRDLGGTSKGFYNGFTAIEICNPNIAKLFTLAKQKLGAGNMQDVEAFIGFVSALQQAGQIDQNTYYQIKDNLSMNNTQKTAVMYYKDADGDILPRFAVKITKFSWKEYGGQCSMTIDHKDEAQDYAGLATSYSDDYSWEMDLDPKTPSSASLWYWDLKALKANPGATEGTEYNYVEVVDAL